MRWVLALAAIAAHRFCPKGGKKTGALAPHMDLEVFGLSKTVYYFSDSLPHVCNCWSRAAEPPRDAGESDPELQQNRATLRSRQLLAIGQQLEIEMGPSRDREFTEMLFLFFAHLTGLFWALGAPVECRTACCGGFMLDAARNSDTNFHFHLQDVKWRLLIPLKDGFQFRLLSEWLSEKSWKAKQSFNMEPDQYLYKNSFFSF